jgi:hypothetical protein
VAADHAGGRAWRVEQDALERFAVPPAGGVAAVGGDQLGAQAQAFEVFRTRTRRLASRSTATTPASGFGFEDVAGLAAGCAAGVEHALARRQVSSRSAASCGFVLHADPAFGEARQAAHVGGGSRTMPSRL